MVSIDGNNLWCSSSKLWIFCLFMRPSPRLPCTLWFSSAASPASPCRRPEFRCCWSSPNQCAYGVSRLEARRRTRMNAALQPAYERGLVCRATPTPQSTAPRGEPNAAPAPRWIASARCLANSTTRSAGSKSPSAVISRSRPRSFRVSSLRRESLDSPPS